MDSMLEEFKKQIAELEELIATDSDENHDEKYYLLQDTFDEIRDYPFQDKEAKILKSLERRMVVIRNDLDIYDEEAERNAMFPNGEDD